MTMKENVRFALRAAGFVLLTAMVLTYAVYVLTPKHDYGVCSMANLYDQPENSIDVLAVGTSLVYAGVNTNVLWAEQGIAAYDLSSAEQPFWISYYAIREALKTQRPKVILLDAKPATYPLDYSTRGRIILSTYGMRGIENRVGATLASVRRSSDAMGYLLALPQVHSNYAQLTAEDFRYPLDNGGRGSDWKGFIEEDRVESHQRPSLVWNGVKRNINEREEAYAEKIFELAKDEGIPLILIGMPNPDYAHDHMYYNALASLAEEYGMLFWNYNDPSLRYGLRYSTDFADWQHLNVKGSVTFSKKLGQDLSELLELPDHRGDDAYDSYERCARTWYERYPLFESSGIKGEEQL